LYFTIRFINNKVRNKIHTKVITRQKLKYEFVKAALKLNIKKVATKK